MTFILIALHGLMTTIAIATNYPRSGGSQPQMGSWRQRGPRRGSAIHLPSGPNKEPIVNPRRWDVEWGGSRPQQHKEFTIDPCWDLVFRRDRGYHLRRDS